MPVLGYAAAAIGTFLITSMNVWSGLDGQHGNDWRVAVYEYTSTALIFALLWPLGQLTCRALSDWSTRKARAVALLAAGLPLFAVTHISGFVALRTAIFTALGMHYSFDGITGWTFELPKEIAVYAILISVLGAATMLARRPTTIFARTDVGKRIVLRDRGRVLHIAPAEIVAISSAGNYIEYHLVGGRKPLVRGTLSACEAELTGMGFARSHRSWLVNTDFVREIEAAGSGDRKLLLSDELEVPLSRRFAKDFDGALAASRSS